MGRNIALTELAWANTHRGVDNILPKKLYVTYCMDMFVRTNRFEMRNTSITFEEALIDAVRFYGEDIGRRSCVEGLRLYAIKDGRKCAIGRLIRSEHEEFFHTFDEDGQCGTIEAVVHEYQKNQRMSGRYVSENEAVKELTYISDATLTDVSFLQILHDDDQNWDEQGLTEFGMETIKDFRPDLRDVVFLSLQEDLHQ